MTIDRDQLSQRQRAVYDLYQLHLGREPNLDAMNQYANSGRTVGEIENIIRNSDEYFRRFNVPQFSVAHGGDRYVGNSSDRQIQQHQRFGPADYIAALRANGPSNAQNTRQDILAWLNQGQNYRWLAPNNRRDADNPAMPGSISLYDRIRGQGTPDRDINPGWGNYDADPNAAAHFTQADLLATRAMGFSDVQIASVLDDNQGWLRSGDRAGVAGGVMESLELTGDDTPIHDTTRPQAPTITNTASVYDVEITRETIAEPTRDSLDLTPGEAFVGRRARGADRALRTRRRVRQTTDLQRSLNV